MNLRKHIKRTTTLSLPVAAAAILWLVLSANGDAPTALAQTGDTPTPEATTEPVGEQGVENFLPLEGKLNPLQYPNMDSNLNHIVQQVQTGQFTAQAAAANAPIHREEYVAVTLYITEGHAQNVWDWLEENGGDPRNIGADYIEAYTPVTLLAQASQQEGVISVRTIIPAQPAQGTVVSEGVAAHGVPAWHAAGLRGQGIKIGVIDVGFKGFTELMGSELPAIAQWRCYTEVGVFTSNPTDCIPENAPESSKLHGTAVTEAIFDIAPEAEYYIANLSTWGDLLDTIDWMTTQGVDVMNMSVGFAFAGPGDGTSPFSNSPLTAVDDAVAGDIVWVNSAGNSARANWFGQFEDSNDNSIHDFSATGDECNSVLIQLDPLEGFTAQLRWDDSWGGASSDLDLYLVSLSGNRFRLPDDAVAKSEELQAGEADDIPLEIIRIDYGDIPNGVYCLAVNRYRGEAPDWVQILVWGAASILQHHTPDHSIGNPAESANPGLLAVGASGRNASSQNPFDTTIIEPFSSQGPTTDDRIKPDIVGADAGQSVTYRTERNPNGYFFGTSQASPHVAGLAALVKQRFPNQTPEQIANYLKDHAEERGEAGADNIWGYGFAKLLASDAPPPTPTDPCIEPLTGSATVNGSWTSDCSSTDPSPNPNDSGNGYARFYTFTLTDAANVTVTLESSEDTYLNIRQGTGNDGTILHSNDDHANENDCTANLNSITDSCIVESLGAGDYTIEATTYESETTGNFTLTVEIGDSTPLPPPPPPPPGGITEHACNEDDLADLEGYTFDTEGGPYSREDGGYTGVVGSYWNGWFNAESDAYIVCTATQFDSIQNARWTGLNYSAIVQHFGSDAKILEHEQAPYILPPIGDDMVSLWLAYQGETQEDLYKASEVRFFDSATITLTRVFLAFRNSNEYPDLNQAANIARNIASRVIPPDSASQSSGAQSPNRLPEFFNRIR